MELVKKLISKLKEEVDYHESVLEHKLKLEATLWGLEEQASFPENSGKEDQQALSLESNNCRSKILNCKKLVSSHEMKIRQILKTFLEN